MDDTERSRSGDDRALDDPVFSDLFDAMRAASSGPAPAMGPELSAMVSGAGVASLTARRTRVRTAIVGLAVLGAVAGGAGAAAAAGVSPSHAARFATSIIQRMPGVDSGPAGVEEDTARGVEQRESPPPMSTQTGDDDEPGASEASPAQVSPSHRPTGAEDDEQSRQTSGLAPGEDEHTAAGEASSTDASDDGDGSQTPSTDTDERTAPSSTSTEDDAGSETSRDTDDSSGTSQEQSDD
jgi:hypothetical protein